MFDHFVMETKAAIDQTLKSAAGFSLIAIVATPAVFFFSFAGFVWVQEQYGTVTAALTLGVVYAAAALAILTAVLVGRRRRREAEPPPSSAAQTKWWADPAVIAAGVEMVRIVGIRRMIPALAVGIALIGVLQAKRGPSNR